MGIIVNNIRADIDMSPCEIIELARAKIKKYGTADEGYLYRISTDARQAVPKFVCSVVFSGIDIDEISEPDIKPFYENDGIEIGKGETLSEKRPVIVGFGPCGMFCALLLAKWGFKPIVAERGESVGKRKDTVDNFYKTGKLSENSNIQFGEGGAGTFSDGKLTTRINNAYCRFVLNTLHRFGAPTQILYEAKPHVGTDRLVKVVEGIRKEIEKYGGTVLFNKTFTDAVIENGKVKRAIFSDGEVIDTDLLILATGHSARDTVTVLSKKISIVPKDFSVGFRIEHLQSYINEVAYKSYKNDPRLPTASYALSYRNGNRGVYSFCMCPGGYIAAAASEQGMTVTNGMSCSKRDGVNANSAIVTDFKAGDFGGDILSGMEFQREMEKKAFLLGGNDFSAPASLCKDYIEGRKSTALSGVVPTYPRGYTFADLNKIYPDKINSMLKEGLAFFNKKHKGFCENGAVLTGVETRTSSPVRILRNEEGVSPDAEGLYPCGEGAGYAGGIVSAAVDGIMTAVKITHKYKLPKGI